MNRVPSFQRDLPTPSMLGTTPLPSGSPRSFFETALLPACLKENKRLPRSGRDELIEDKYPTMTFIEKINKELALPKTFEYTALDLFAGCGGLSLGFESCGIRTIGYEMEADYASTYRTNLVGECHCVRLDTNQKYPDDVSVVIGGPPCQPFSVGGKQLGLKRCEGRFSCFHLTQ